MTITIVGIAGSLRRKSINRVLLAHLASVAPEGVEVVIASIDDIPLFNGDIEDEGTPASVQRLKDQIAAADGVLLVTPEYNHSMPGVLKNAIDWASRLSSSPDSVRVFRGKPIGIAGASPGRRGTALGQDAWLPVFRALGVVPWWGGELHVGQAHSAFDDDGNVINARIEESALKFIEGFAAFVQSSANSGAE